MTILLTGGMGAIGSWVARELVEASHRLVLYDARTDFSLIPDLEGRIEVVTGDLLDLPSLVRTVLEKKVERILHLAAIMPSQAQANPYQGFQVNALGTVHVLEAARIAGVQRVVYTSSKGAYGPISGEHAHPTYRPVTDFLVNRVGSGVIQVGEQRAERSARVEQGLAQPGHAG